jgi:phosphatidylglycerophosphate synthase
MSSCWHLHDANDAIRGEVTTHTRVVKRRWRIADVLSAARLLLIPAIWFAALLGNGRLVGVGLLVAGATDFFDGYVARRLGQESAAGARLDSLADNVLLISAMAWIELLHPEILRDNTTLVVATFGFYVASLSAGMIKFHQLGNLHLYSSRVAGGALYSFAVITLLVGAYEPLLLWLATGAFMVSSAETLVGQLLLSGVDENMGSIFLAARRRAEIRTIQPIGSARKHRSQEPHSANVVGSTASPTSSTATSAAPNANETCP